MEHPLLLICVLLMGLHLEVQIIHLPEIRKLEDFHTNLLSSMGLRKWDFTQWEHSKCETYNSYQC